ncbi:MAG: hypothetical protein ACPGXX_22310, partial [Planctomycetaceae bacterium]
VVVTSGQPGKGQFLLLRRGDETPRFVHSRLFNCHNVDVLPDGRFVACATNRNSPGNGAVRDPDGSYRGNTSPLQMFAVIADDAASRIHYCRAD